MRCVRRPGPLRRSGPLRNPGPLRRPGPLRSPGPLRRCGPLRHREGEDPILAQFWSSKFTNPFVSLAPDRAKSWTAVVTGESTRCKCRDFAAGLLFLVFWVVDRQTNKLDTPSASKFTVTHQRSGARPAAVFLHSKYDAILLLYVCLPLALDLIVR